MGSQLDELAARVTGARQQSDYPAAAEAYRQILRLRPEFVAARLDLALMQYSLRSYRAAIQSLEGVLPEIPDSILANLVLGLSFLRQQEADRVLPYLNRA